MINNQIAIIKQLKGEIYGFWLFGYWRLELVCILYLVSLVISLMAAADKGQRLPAKGGLSWWVPLAVVNLVET